MLFRVTPSNSLEHVSSDWILNELDLEKYLITNDNNVRMMSASVFGESLLFVSNQVSTRKKKRADILALDRAGNGVIIELKRDAARLGVETQALQYLADFSKYRGAQFTRRFLEDGKNVPEDTVRGFVDGQISLDDLNSRSRVILVARSFDETLFSMGEWLSSKGVAFRCIEYHPAKVGNDRFLSFSVVFDRSPESIYPLGYGSAGRAPRIFWHNIGEADQGWWKYLVEHGQIPASFDNSAGDQGERILSRFVVGDKIVAYAKGYGAVGYGVVDDPNSYRLITSGSKDDVMKSSLRHRLSVSWKAVALKLSDGVPAEEVRRQFNIYHPVSTSVAMNTADGNKLVDHLIARFSSR